jgi:murein L,D-transpeptidase YcbB/YkuD
MRVVRARTRAVEKQSEGVVDAFPAVLKEGMSGPLVEALQQALWNARVRTDPPTGVFDSHTTDEVKEFQKQNDLTVDGIVGRATLGKLSSYLEVMIWNLRPDQSAGESADAHPGLPWTGLTVEKAKQYF